MHFLRLSPHWLASPMGDSSFGCAFFSHLLRASPRSVFAFHATEMPFVGRPRGAPTRQAAVRGRGAGVRAGSRPAGPRGRAAPRGPGAPRGSALVFVFNKN